MPLNSAIVVAACSTSPWDLGNEVLYSLCRTHPTHANREAVIAKVWLIGRSYAAAIERGRGKSEKNDDFYADKVAPQILASEIDQWLQKLVPFTHPNSKSLPHILRTHGQVTALFKQISGMDKRSLASKYLHFHLPHLFYIFDSRAVEAMRKLSGLVGRALDTQPDADREYDKFAQKCLLLQNHVTQELGISMLPRGLDNLLLRLHTVDA
jgi:hypothetical protein